MADGATSDSFPRDSILAWATSHDTIRFHQPSTTDGSPCSARQSSYREEGSKEDHLAEKEAGLTSWGSIDAPTVRHGG